MFLILILYILTVIAQALPRGDGKNERNGGDLALWIDEKQVKMFSGEYWVLRFRLNLTLRFDLEGSCKSYRVGSVKNSL